MPNILNITARFYPVRILALIRNEIDMDVVVENKSSEVCWAETAVFLPKELSLSSEKKLAAGRLRVGIIPPNEKATTRCKIYANSQTDPGTYKINLVGYAYDKNGIVLNKDEAKTELRCVRVGEK